MKRIDILLAIVILVAFASPLLLVIHDSGILNILALVYGYLLLRHWRRILPAPALDYLDYMSGKADKWDKASSFDEVEG